MKKTVPRSTDQNRLMWQRLTDWAQQDSRYTFDGQRLDPHDFKELLMAAFKREVRLTPNLENNGVVYLSRSTSRLLKDQMSEFLEFIAAEGSKRGIVFRDTPPTPAVPRNEDELRAALKASVELTKGSGHV